MSTNNVFDSASVQGQKPSVSAYGTTAALEQGNAATPQVAGAINTNASLERSAAKEAANVAKGVGEKLTGNPEGDANTERVKQALTPHTDVHIAQNHSSSQGTQTSNLTGKVSETAAGVQSKAKETVDAASAKASETATTASDGTKGLYGTITDTASAAVQTAKDTATSALETAQGYLGMGTSTTGQADTGVPPASSTGIPATSAPLESGKHIGEPYPSSNKVAGGGVQVANVETQSHN
ncbi:hypothetical protein EST38_g6695 [Candolleomyces aberdarensis]|uniref:Uncharacterized protein n=1 Tax=Candolleomyces aberdarensis TaxID=2316362 RepID=A0A4V1Q3N1_9AGAR|nr:hypothetical protein EST38_g6695 [Candolleomyces aberdarensis]